VADARSGPVFFVFTFRSTPVTRRFSPAPTDFSLPPSSARGFDSTAGGLPKDIGQVELRGKD
jgi:hypothetical protein